MDSKLLTKEEKSLKNKSTINKNNLQMLINLLKFYSLDEIKRLKIFEERTFYRYQAKLKQLGFDKTNVVNGELTIQTSFNYDMYYNILMNPKNNKVIKHKIF